MEDLRITTILVASFALFATFLTFLEWFTGKTTVKEYKRPKLIFIVLFIFCLVVSIGVDVENNKVKKNDDTKELGKEKKTSQKLTFIQQLLILHKQMYDLNLKISQLRAKAEEQQLQQKIKQNESSQHPNDDWSNSNENNTESTVYRVNQNSEVEKSISLSDRRISAGNGRLIVRSVCETCGNQYNITVKNEATNISGFMGNFDSLNKEHSSFIYELKPGNYVVKIEYFSNQYSTFEVVVYEGKASIYYFNRKNPYGKSYGRGVFLSKYNDEEWLVEVNGEKIGVTKKLSSAKNIETTALYKNFLPGKYYYEFKPVDKQNTLDPEHGYFTIEPGKLVILEAE